MFLNKNYHFVNILFKKILFEWYSLMKSLNGKGGSQPTNIYCMYMILDFITSNVNKSFTLLRESTQKVNIIIYYSILEKIHGKYEDCIIATFFKIHQLYLRSLLST